MAVGICMVSTLVYGLKRWTRLKKNTQNYLYIEGKLKKQFTKIE